MHYVHREHKFHYTVEHILFARVSTGRSRNPITGLDRSGGFQKVEAPRFQDNRLMKVVRLSALRTVHLYPKEIFLVLISVRGRVNPKTIMRPERCQWKIQMTPLGNRTGDLPALARCLNQHTSKRDVCLSGYDWGVGCTDRSIVPIDEMVNNDSNFNVDYDEKNTSRDKMYLQNTANNTIHSTVCIISQVFYDLTHH